MKTRNCRLALASLEERVTPAVYNNAWADSGHITLSFAPDGTDVNGTPSKLFEQMGPATSTWQQAILRAFQTWASAVNINVEVVPDDGSPFGSSGPTQGDARHGDIRIAARSLGSEELAIANPFDLLQGWSGNVIVNTDQPFNLGGTNGAYDLYTVMLHEAGHALGLPHHDESTSIMSEDYHGVTNSLTSVDLSAICTLYGVRAHDRFDAFSNNGSLSSATPISYISSLEPLIGLDGTVGAAPSVAAGDLSSLTDVDYYKVSSTSLAAWNVSLRTSGISSLTARLTLLDSLGQPIASVSANDPTKGDLTLSSIELLPVGTYYVKVEKAADDVFGVGAYRLAAGVAANDAVNDPVIAGLVRQDYHSDDEIGRSTPLSLTNTSTDLRWDYTLHANLLDMLDVDYYSVKAPTADLKTLVVAAWGKKAGDVHPLIEVYDALKQPLRFEVLSSDASNFTLQVPNIVPGDTYYIRVGHDPDMGARLGQYFLGADFRADGVKFHQLASGTLTQSAPQASTTLTVHQTQLIHFRLSAFTPDLFTGSAGIRMSIFDSKGREVFTLFARVGNYATGDVILAAGDYTVVFTGGTPDGTNMPSLGFTLDCLVRTDPMGASPTDSSSSPSGGNNPPPPPSSSETSTYNGPYTNPYRPS